MTDTYPASMHRTGWNPERRNRHVGTEAHGYGADNRLVIPDDSHGALHFFEPMRRAVRVLRPVQSRDIEFWVEPPSTGYFHPCTVDDVAQLLRLVSGQSLRALGFVVLRQPTRKQRILRPVWGRAVFSFRPPQGADAPAVVLEAQSPLPLRWGKSLAVEDVQELDRLRADGHDVRPTRRGWEIGVTPQSLRNHFLQRTVLHELGHLLDWQSHTLVNWASRPPREREDFAVRYARCEWADISGRGLAPFAPWVDEDQMRSEGLNPAWFRPA